MAGMARAARLEASILNSAYRQEDFDWSPVLDPAAWDQMRGEAGQIRMAQLRVMLSEKPHLANKVLLLDSMFLTSYCSEPLERPKRDKRLLDAVIILAPCLLRSAASDLQGPRHRPRAEMPARDLGPSPSCRITTSRDTTHPLQVAPGDKFPQHLEHILMMVHHSHHYSVVYVHKPFGFGQAGAGKSILHYDSLSASSGMQRQIRGRGLQSRAASIILHR